MAFEIKKRRSLARRVIFAVMAVAVAMQPIYSVVSHELAANAADNTPSGVVINEIKPATGSGEKWIELYNPTDASKDLGDWRIVRGGKNWGGVIADGVSIAKGGFYTIDAKASSDSLPLDSSTVELWSGTTGSGSKIDSVKYPT
ncbi:MAG: lamin tail domain-containing protein, partial [Candidatus Nanoperiomorbaceae bacterium]